LTYGEAHVAELDSIKLIKGEFVKTLHISYKPVPMNRTDAGVYYNTKLYKYWLGLLNEESPQRRILNEKWIKIRMFGTPEEAKLLED